MKTSVKVTTASGNHFETAINLPFADAEKYYLNEVREIIDENFDTGEETRDRIIKVESL